MTATIDWSRIAGPMPATLWAINENVILDRKDGANDPQFQELLGALHVSLLRIHDGGLCNSWTDATTRDWDATKIKHAFAVSTGYGDARVMLNIPRWPKWLSESRVLEPEKEEEFAGLCARLVKLLRDDVKHPITYWEITNECEQSYAAADNLPGLWRLYNKIAVAIRRQDPNARLGGPAVSWPRQEWLEGFLRNCPDAQFLSWHNYGSGQPSTTNEALFGKVENDLGPNADRAQDLVRHYGGGRPMETFLTETNVQYTWNPYERRQQNQVGALYLASVINKLAASGTSGVLIWQQKTRPYGSLIGPSNEIFPAYHLYFWGTHFLTGQRLQSAAEDGKSLEVLAVEGAGAQRSVLLLNKADHTLILPSAGTLLPGVWRAEQLNADGYLPDLRLCNDKLALPGLSLTLLTTSNN